MRTNRTRGLIYHLPNVSHRKYERLSRPRNGMPRHRRAAQHRGCHARGVAHRAMCTRLQHCARLHGGVHQRVLLSVYKHTEHKRAPLAKPKQRSKTMPRHTQKQKAAFNQGKRDGAEHGKTVQDHLNTHKAEVESYKAGVERGKKSYTLKRKSNRKLGRKYQVVLNQMCETSESLQEAKTQKVNTMLDDLTKVVDSADVFVKQKTKMQELMANAGDDKAKRKKCAQYIMELVKNYRIRGRDDEEDPAAMCIKELNDHIAANTKNIKDICKSIYQEYIENRDALQKFLQTMEKPENPITDEEISRIVKAMENQIKAMDKEDSKAAGKTYRKNQRMKSRPTSEAGSDVEYESSVGLNSGRSSATQGTPGSGRRRRSVY